MTKSVFISYAHTDHTVAEYIAAELRNRGCDVFIDYQSLQAGNFAQQLGIEIEKRDTVILLLSPESVESKWVQAEVAWAFTCKKPIVPVLLDPATSLVNMFFIVNLQPIDFTRWSMDGDGTEAVREISRLLKLPEQPLHSAQVPDLTVGDNPHPSAKPPAEPASLAFAIKDLSEILFTAAEVADNDPEQAIFLYQRIVETDPNYLDGRAREFIEREQETLHSLRLEKLLARADVAVAAGEWTRGERIGQDMLKLDANNADARKIIQLCQRNVQCEPLYKQAVLAAERGRWQAVYRLIRDVRHICPDYGDPARALRIHPRLATLITEAGPALKGHTDSVNALTFSPNSHLLASGSSDKSIKLWDMRDLDNVATLPGHENSVRALAFSPDGHLLASGSDDVTVKIWDVRERRSVAPLAQHSGYVNAVAFSIDGMLASGAGDKTVRLWDIAKLRTVATLPLHETWVSTMAFSPDGQLLASGLANGTIQIWNVAKRQAEATLTGHNYSVNSVVFSPADKRLLASGAGDKTVRLWDVNDRRVLKTFDGHRETVTSIAFSPDGTLLASGSVDGTIQLWSVADRNHLHTINLPDEHILAVAFSPDGTLLATGLENGSIHLWGMG
jgi:hypothetical protein